MRSVTHIPETRLAESMIAQASTPQSHHAAAPSSVPEIVPLADACVSLVILYAMHVMQKRVASGPAGAAAAKRPAPTPGTIRTPRMTNRIRRDGKIEAGEMELPSMDSVCVPACRDYVAKHACQPGLCGLRRG